MSCLSLGWMVKPSGGLANVSPMWTISLAGTPVSVAERIGATSSCDLRRRALETGVVRGVGVAVAGRGPTRGLLLLGLARLDEDPLELLLVVAQRGLGVLDADVAATDERLGVELADAALGLDEVVHQRLRHRRVVALVVTAAAVAHHVDDDVLVELLAELVGQLGHAHAGLGVVAVDVEDRRLDHPGDVGGVHRGARAARRRREADLVVDDDVDRAAGAVAAQLREVERLGDDALAGEGRVAVHEHGQHGEGLAGEVEPVLLGPHDALEHRVDRLEVRGVRRRGRPSSCCRPRRRTRPRCRGGT